MDLSDLIPLTIAANIIPDRPHPSTVWRWALKGVRAPDGSRVRLRHARVGRRIYTSRAALIEFFEAAAEAHVCVEEQAVERNASTSRRRASQIEASEEFLRDAGVL